MYSGSAQRVVERVINVRYYYYYYYATGKKQRTILTVAATTMLQIKNSNANKHKTTQRE